MSTDERKICLDSYTSIETKLITNNSKINEYTMQEEREKIGLQALKRKQHLNQHEEESASPKKKLAIIDDIQLLCKRPTHIKTKPINTWKNKYIIARKEMEILKLKLENMTELIKHKNKEISTKSIEMEKIRALNFTLQNIIMEKIDKISVVVEKINQPFTHQPRKNSESSLHPPIGEENSTEEKTHIGNNIWVPTDKYKYFFNSRKPSLFLINLARCVFTTEELQTSTVTGRRSNASKKTTPTPNKLDVNKVAAIRECFEIYLNEKYSKLKTEEANIKIDKALERFPSWLSHLIADEKKKLADPKNTEQKKEKSKNNSNKGQEDENIKIENNPLNKDEEISYIEPYEEIMNYVKEENEYINEDEIDEKDIIIENMIDENDESVESESENEDNIIMRVNELNVNRMMMNEYSYSYIK